MKHERTDKENYDKLLQFVSNRDMMIMGSIKELLKTVYPDIENERRYHSEHLHELVSLLLDSYHAQVKGNQKVREELTRQQYATKLWQEAADELAKQEQE